MYFHLYLILNKYYNNISRLLFIGCRLSFGVFCIGVANNNLLRAIVKCDLSYYVPLHHETVA